MIYPENPITVGQILQRSIDRIMQQPKTTDNIYDDSAFRQFLLTAGANEEQSLVNQLLIYEQAPETAVYIKNCIRKTGRQNRKARHSGC